ncbi:hypothetical protein VIBNISOn1_p0048 [Vibrio nigripulchritudo SOn1]|uniref:Uncharacterized protein n=1 Tax=Vibrio nigripulchritudo SOn1 TaxID=1238450 RepID=A0AAV2W114_9VIBR|nr:hypothetical protein VIBNISOn1_p0048 [Vibrio nigripulchritudo SOn1]
MTSKIFDPFYTPWVKDDAKERSRMPLRHEGDTDLLKSITEIVSSNVGQHDIWGAHSPSVVNVLTRLLTESSLATY